MILIDFSQVFCQNIFGAVSGIKPVVQESGKYNTEDFIDFALYNLTSQLFDYYRQFHTKFGEIFLCLDGSRKANWRTQLFPYYKDGRDKNRAESPINWTEVYAVADEYTDTLDKYSSFRVLRENTAEGDDIILKLAIESGEDTVIISTDKDMLQAQRNPRVKQYSPMKKAFISTDDTKGDTLAEWKIEHVCLGDACDNVPGIFNGTIFAEHTKQYIKDMNVYFTEKQYYDLPVEKRVRFKKAVYMHGLPEGSEFSNDDFEHFSLFEKFKIGPKTLKKKLQTIGLEKILSTNEMVKARYELNQKLVLEEYIPMDVKNRIFMVYNLKNTTDTVTDYGKLNEFFAKHHMQSLAVELPSIFSQKREMTIDDLW